MTCAEFLSEHLRSVKLNSILMLSVPSFMCTSLGLALAHCRNLQLQKPKSHIKLKDLFWSIERFIVEKVKIGRIGTWRTLSCMPHPSWALQFCSLNSCLHRETRKPGENSDMDGIVQTLPTLGLCGFIFQPKSPLKAVIMMLRPTHKKKTVSSFSSGAWLHFGLQKILWVFTTCFWAQC